MDRTEQARLNERFDLICLGATYFQVMVAGCRLKLFNFLSENPDSGFDEIRRHLKIPEYSARVLLQSCSALKLIEKNTRKKTYRNGYVAEVYLVESKPTNFVSFILWMNEGVYQPMFHLTESLKKGTNLGLKELPGPGGTLFERLSKYPKLEKLHHDAMDDMSEKIADAIATLPELQRIKRLADVGGGDGKIAIRLQKKLPHLDITVCEFESVCKLAEKNIRKAGATAGCDTHPGDIFKRPFPKGIEGLLLVRVLTGGTQEQNRKLLKKCYKSLPKRGIVVIVGPIFSDDDETGPQMAAALSPYFLALETGRGMLYPEKDYIRWIKEAGFSSVKKPSSLNGIIVGIK